VGIAVKDFDAAMAYYTKTIGLREAYSLKQPDGRPLLTYLHVSRDTFLELQPATAALPPGLTHFAVEFGDLKSAVTRMRQQGATMADPGLTPGRALFTRLRDLDGVQIEAMEFGPESQQRKAMDAYK
jgi:catechol 2,3-dioxygenase-like lactoylglutathione lyase family enzyme